MFYKEVLSPVLQSQTLLIVDGIGLRLIDWNTLTAASRKDLSFLLAWYKFSNFVVWVQ